MLRGFGYEHGRVFRKLTPSGLDYVVLIRSMGMGELLVRFNAVVAGRC